ncbi:MAG: hypothetical protein PHS79_03415 [Patescibacteria group bacterium]|nr:hypothetical protein [Patescibacteria group bacterium]
MTQKNIIDLQTDEYEVSQKDHDAIKELIEGSGYKLRDIRCDTHAIGGPVWFPTGLILSMGSHLFDAVLAVICAKGLDMIIASYKRIANKSSYSGVNLVADINKNLSVYFDLDTYNYETGEIITNQKLIAQAIKKISPTFNQLLPLLTNDLLEFLGKPMRIIMRYDFQIKKWLIFDHDSNASIYFADTAFEHKKPPSFPLF